MVVELALQLAMHAATVRARLMASKKIGRRDSVGWVRVEQHCSA
jgi:hypothetical protein